MDLPHLPSDAERLMSTHDPLESSSQIYPIKSSLEWLEDMQEDLRDAREDLVGSRFRLRTKRQELRATGEKAFGAMGRAFDLMQRYFLIEQPNVPEEVASAWLQVEKIRISLGEQDIDYEQAEKDYNMEEWKYTEMESRFVQSIQGRNMPHLDSYDQSALANAYKEPTQLSFQPSDSVIKDELAVELDRSHPFPGVPMTVTSSQGEQEVRASMDSHSASVTDTTSIFSSLGANPADDLSETDSQERELGYYCVSGANLFCKDDRGDTNPDRWLNSRQNIDRWMLDVLKTSSLQRQWLECFVPKATLSDNEWLALVTQYWVSDSSDDSVFHTGDTTVPDESLNQEAFSDDIQHPFASSVYCNSEPWQPPGSPILPDDWVADHQASFDNPVKISKRDLVDAPRHVSFSTVPSRSYSDPARFMSAVSITSKSDRSSSATSTTTYTKDASAPPPSYAKRTIEPCSTRTKAPTTGPCSSFASTGSSSNSTIEAESSHVFSAAKCAVRPEGRLPYERSPTPSYLHDTSKVDSYRVRTQSNELRSPQAHVHTYMEPSEILHSTLAHSELKKQTLPGTNTQAPTTSQDVTGRENKKAVQQPWSHTRYPFAPFIRVKNPEHWTLPLLRLTPISNMLFKDMKLSSHSSRLENLPFVSISDTPQRLPGPSSSWIGEIHIQVASRY